METESKESITELYQKLPEHHRKTIKCIVAQKTGNDMEWTWGARERSIEMQLVLIFTRMHKKMSDVVWEFNQSLNQI